MGEDFNSDAPKRRKRSDTKKRKRLSLENCFAQESARNHPKEVENNIVIEFTYVLSSVQDTEHLCQDYVEGFIETAQERNATHIVQFVLPEKDEYLLAISASANETSWIKAAYEVRPVWGRNAPVAYRVLNLKPNNDAHIKRFVQTFKTCSK